MESEKFKEYLITGSLNGLVSIPKSDLHNHASNGGNVEFVKKYANIDIELPPSVFSSITDMEKWAHANIKKYIEKKMRYKAAFMQAKDDGISVLAMCVFRDEMDAFGTCAQFIEMFNDMKNAYIPGTLFLPEISYFGSSDDVKIDYEYSLLDEILSYNYFKSIELCTDELSQPYTNYKKFSGIFKKAKKHGLKLKAHVGEYGTADDIMRAVEELELDEVHHGIGAFSSPQVMKWLARHKIQLNVCPTSNVMLGRVRNYKERPIKVLYDYGIPITMNSDDMLIFNQSVSQEYFNLYNCGLMNVDELDKIRKTGLSAPGY
jgi:adenosine deaminase